MRIIAGKYRNFVISAPKGINVRPTTDRVRESMFSSLISLKGSFDFSSVLDAFAGSGALGLESYSRGAQTVDFFEKDSLSFSNLINNVKKFPDEKKSLKVFKQDITKTNFEIFGSSHYDLVFFDPPYKMTPDNVLNIISKLKLLSKINSCSIIVYEHGRNMIYDDFQQLIEEHNLRLIKSKSYGDTVVDFLNIS